MNAISQSAISRTGEILVPRALINSEQTTPDLVTSLTPKLPQSPPLRDGLEIVDFIIAAMSANEESAIAKQILEKNEQFKTTQGDKVLPEGQRLFCLIEAAKLFKSMVGNKCPWDYKWEIGEKWGGYSLLFGQKIPKDVWGNIHYGFIGVRVGFPPELILMAAGAYQLYSGTTPSDWLSKMIGRDIPFFEALDDERDQNSANIGITMGLMKEKPSVESLVKLMKANIGKIIEI